MGRDLVILNRKMRDGIIETHCLGESERARLMHIWGEKKASAKAPRTLLSLGSHTEVSRPGAE